MSDSKIRFAELAANGTQATILQAVRDVSPISRTGIVSLTGQPHAAVSRSIATLLDTGLVTESALTDTRGPRRKRGIKLNPQFGYCLAVEYRTSVIEGVVVNTAYETVLSETHQVHFTDATEEEITKMIINFLKELKDEVPESLGRCLGVAVVDPGAIDTVAGMTIMATSFKHWANVRIVEIIENHLHLPVILLNTSTAKIRAIDRLELRNAYKNVAYIEYGDGIGCGLKLEGNYIQGCNNVAGELGHIRVTDEPVLCRCGGYGCLEAVAALHVLAEKAMAVIADDMNMSNQAEIDGIKILEAAAKGDRLATYLVDQAFDYLGRAVATLVNIVNPEVVVFDNKISVAGEEAYNVLLRSLRKYTFHPSFKSLDLRISQTGSYLGALGGAASVMDRCLEY